MVGTEIGPYRLDALLQVEGSVSSYSATHITLQRTVKVFLQHKNVQPSLSVRAQMLSRPGVQTTQLLDYFETDAYQVLVVNEAVGLAHTTDTEAPDIQSNHYPAPSWLDKHKHSSVVEAQADKLKFWLSIAALILGVFLLYLLIRSGIQYMVASISFASMQGKLKTSIESKLDWGGLTFSLSSVSALLSVALQRWFSYFSFISMIGKWLNRALVFLVCMTGLYLFCLVKYPEPTHQVTEYVKKIIIKT